VECTKYDKLEAPSHSKEQHGASLLYQTIALNSTNRSACSKSHNLQASFPLLLKAIWDQTGECNPLRMSNSKTTAALHNVCKSEVPTRTQTHTPEVHTPIYTHNRHGTVHTAHMQARIQGRAGCRCTWQLSAAVDTPPMSAAVLNNHMYKLLAEQGCSSKVKRLSLASAAAGNSAVR
jgi:hypothetical protein